MELREGITVHDGQENLGFPVIYSITENVCLERLPVNDLKLNLSITV
jgi:hypothetical protein